MKTATDSEIAARLNEIGFPKPDQLPRNRRLAQLMLEDFFRGRLLVGLDYGEGKGVSFYTC